MIVERVTFDRIFDVVAWRGDFSFESGGRLAYAANLRPGMIPRPGASYAIVLAVANDWSSVLGWRDLSSDAVSLSPSLSYFDFQYLEDGFWAMLALLVVASGVVFVGALALLAVPLLFIGIHIAGMRRVVLQRRAVRRLLLAVG